MLKRSYIPGLLFADDRALLSPDESQIKKSLDVLVEWCRELGGEDKCEQVWNDACEAKENGISAVGWCNKQ